MSNGSAFDCIFKNFGFSSAMKVYELQKGVVADFIRETARSTEEGVALYFLVTKEIRFRYVDLTNYGLNPDDIDIMVSAGLLREIEVDRSTTLSIAGHHKYATDETYRENALSSLAKARANIKRSGVGLKEARRRRVARFKKRRERLLKEVIIPEFGVDGELPEDGVSIKAVEEVLGKYPEVLEMYPDGIYDALFYDIGHMGIRVADRYEKIGETWIRKLKENPFLLSKLQRRAAEATARRLEIYEEEPERADAAHKASAATRKRKMQTDPKFAKKTRENLSKGPGAFLEKCDTDPKFKAKADKNARAGLTKGNKIKKKRIARRRKALKSLVERRFGHLHGISVPKLTSYLEEKRPSFIERYYFGRFSYGTLKKDMIALRREHRG